MVVQHNLTAMNSNRMLGLTTKTQAKSTEKLSSGYKINRAADDAAGLSISEKMRKQIRGLTQASLNAQDGISAVQTAEGALTEVHDMLQRMNELAVKAANGTNSSDDRGYIQNEVDQLISEINRVSETTKFNETYLLKGDGTETREVDKVTPGEDAVAMTAKYKNPVQETIAVKNGATAPGGWFLAGSSTAMTATDILDSLEIKEDGTVGFKTGKDVYKVAAVTNSEYGAQQGAQKVGPTDISNIYEKSSNVLKNAATGGDDVAEEDLASYFNEDGTYKGGLFAKQTTGGTYAAIGAEQIANFVTVTPGKEAIAEKTEKVTETYTKALTLVLHVGADGTMDNTISLDIESMSAKGIGVDELKVGTEDEARASIESLKSAIQRVSTQRSALGAIQNRLEHTINNLDNVVENTTSAESQIRDTDMATEMVRYSNNNILAQAGQAMLAQANQSNQGVLSLLG